MQILKLHTIDNTFVNLDENSIIHAGDDNEFFWEHNDEAVPEGTPVGIEMPVYEGEPFDDGVYLNFDLRDYSTLEDLAGVDCRNPKWHELRDTALEEFINGEHQPTYIQLVLFKNIYLQDDE